MTDKSKELIASISLLNNKLHFRGMIGENEPVSIYFTPPFGDNLGYTSLELLLLSLSSCVGSAILTFYCPVWAMLKGNDKIDIDFKIVA